MCVLATTVVRSTVRSVFYDLQKMKLCMKLHIDVCCKLCININMHTKK